MLVFDEPTAVLTPQETDELMEIMRELKAAGTAIVFITHKLREVREVADRITVIRLGKVVGEASPTASNAELAALMVGRPVELTVHKDPPKLGDEAFVVDGLTVIDPTGHVHVNDVSFSIRAGEVLAVAGVQGNGQTELTEAIVGLAGPCARDRSGSTAPSWSAARSARSSTAGVGFIPEDRLVEGLVAGMTISENLMLNRSFGRPFVQRGSLQLRKLDSFAKEKLKEYDVRAPGVTHARREAVRRQPAEGGRGARAVARAAPPRRRPADARGRRRLHRVHPQADRRGPRLGSSGARGLVRARRGGRARGPDHGRSTAARWWASCPRTPPATSSA